MSTVEPEKTVEPVKTVEPEKKRRGRPPKNPEDKIQDLKAYHKEWYENHKDDEHVRAQTRKNNSDKNKRTRELYTLIKSLVLNDEIGGSDEHIKKIKNLTNCKK